MIRKLAVSLVVAVALVGILAAAPSVQAHEPPSTGAKCMHGHHVYVVYFMPRFGWGFGEWRYAGTFRHRWMAEERAWDLRSSGLIVRVESEWRPYFGF
jgi:hypothetical protein